MCNNTAKSSVYVDEELVDVAASVLPELKSETYSKVHVCAAQKLAGRGSLSRVPASERSHRKLNSGPSSPSREEQGTYLPLLNPGLRQPMSSVALPTCWHFKYSRLSRPCLFFSLT